MPAPRRVSERQMEVLVEFAETHRDVALGRFSAGPQGARAMREAWESVAGRLNLIAEGRTKTPDQWRRYWIEFKAKTKTKAADSRRNAAATGGGPNKLIPLSAMEERVLAIIGPVAVEGLPGVRLPINTSEDEIDAPVLPSPTTIAPPHSLTSDAVQMSSDMYEEWLEEEILQPHALPQPPSPRIRLSTQADVSGEDRPAQHVIPSQPDSATSRSRLRRPSNRGERVPRWAYDMEMRRIAAEERHAAAMEAMVNVMTSIRDDLHTFINRLN